MCGRFTQTAPVDELQRQFATSNALPSQPPRYNVAPGQPITVVHYDPDRRERRMDLVQWGLIPSWSKDPVIGRKLINARAETAHEKPSFRSAFRRHRCLVPADGFYEWRQEGRRKQPTYIRLVSRAPFGMAGLYSHWQSPDGSHVDTCAILTTSPNAVVKPVHHRMPVMIPQAAYEQWLDPDSTDVALLQQLCRPYEAETMEAYPVSVFVNAPQHDTPACIAPDPEQS